MSDAPVTGPADAAARALLAAPVVYESKTWTVAELIAEFTREAWKAESRFANWKTAVYLAAVNAGLVPGVAAGDKIGEVDIAAAEALTEAAIRAMGQPSPLIASLRWMISARQLVIADAGISNGLAPDWQPVMFTAAEIEAAIAIASGSGAREAVPDAGQAEPAPRKILSGGGKVEHLVHRIYGIPDGL